MNLEIDWFLPYEIANACFCMLYYKTTIIVLRARGESLWNSGSFLHSNENTAFPLTTKDANYNETHMWLS